MSLEQITFVMPQGVQPVISIVRGGGLHSTNSPDDITVRSKGQYSIIVNSQFSQASQHTQQTCSNRGTCDFSSGICDCYKGFHSSNGMGGNGTIGDCGYHFQHVYKYTYNGTTFSSNCPVVNNSLVCGGATRGSCNTVTGACTCNTGYGTGALHFFVCCLLC